MKILFSQCARDDLEALRIYLHDVSPMGLQNVLATIKSTVQDIPSSISRGRVTPHKEVWEKVVPKYGYVIPYTIHRDTVYILHVYNSRKKPLDYKQIKKDVERFLDK